MLKVISLGAGVQSTTMALMAAHGELPMPDAAIFADTQWEPAAVYEHLDRLTPTLPFPVYRVSAGNLHDNILRSTNSTGQQFATVPWFTANGGMGRRQCTNEFKIEPLRKKQRELLGYPPRARIPKGSIEVWIGITLDEAIRMKPAREPWQINRWPLIERQMTRRDCAKWLADRGWSVPKSACIGCPYHSDNQWRDLRDNHPDEWADANAVDHAIRANGTTRSIRFHQYMHRSRKPLDEVDLSTPADWGQGDLFGNECEGLCGV